MLHAESNTGRKFSTRYERSPELMRAVQTFQYWQLRFRQARRLSVSQPRLASLQLQAGLLEADISISSVDRILQCLQQAATSLRDYQKRHRELRAKYLEELAEAIVLDRSPDLEHSSMVHVKEDRVTNQIKQLLKRENMRRMFRKIKRVLKPVARMGLSKIEVPDPTARSTENGDPSNLKTWKGPWITATKPNDIAAVIKDINCTQYYQAHGTPFGSGPVAAAFGHRGDTAQAAELLQGSVPSDLHDLPMLSETRRIVDTMAPPYPIVPDPNGSVSQDDFISAYSIPKRVYLLFSFQ
jgi:hypothetical protein